MEKFLEAAPDLQSVTKAAYLRALKIVMNEIFPQIAELDLISEPEKFNFEEKIIEYCNSTNFGLHYRPHLVKPFVAYALRAGDLELENKWRKIIRRINEPINEQYLSNEPTARQAAAWIEYDVLVQIIPKIDNLDEKLLFMMYLLIPPVRCDYYATKLYFGNYSAAGRQFIIAEDKANYIIVADSKLVLQKYKTSKIYDKIEIDLPSEIMDLILQLDREYLFVSARYSRPFTASQFDIWANRTLRKWTGNDFISLTTLRHIYITRRDLELERQSGTVRNEIAKQMGHSIAQQSLYSWHASY